MADIDLHISNLVISSNNIQSLIHGLVGLLYMVLNDFGILCFISGWSGIGLFLAAVYFYQHMTFMRLHQHASFALISLLLFTSILI